MTKSVSHFRGSNFRDSWEFKNKRISFLVFEIGLKIDPTPKFIWGPGCLQSLSHTSGSLSEWTTFVAQTLGIPGTSKMRGF